MPKRASVVLADIPAFKPTRKNRGNTDTLLPDTDNTDDLHSPTRSDSNKDKTAVPERKRPHTEYRSSNTNNPDIQGNKENVVVDNKAQWQRRVSDEGVVAPPSSVWPTKSSSSVSEGRKVHFDAAEGGTGNEAEGGAAARRKTSSLRKRDRTPQQQQRQQPPSDQGKTPEDRRKDLQNRSSPAQFKFDTIVVCIPSPLLHLR